MSLAPGNGLSVAQQRHAGLPGGLWGPQQQAITAGPLQQDGIHADTRPRLLGRVPETQEEERNNLDTSCSFFPLLLLLFLGVEGWQRGRWGVGGGWGGDGGGEKNEEGVRLTDMIEWVALTFH